ncbi:MAG: hypothetical protein ALECFALPRED_006349 [Alectoria fallacina]|uniref:Uncharacterized protein n=1 Tax=Alectoria fallacina TaxID=1903189 RepID=A0A8H3G8Z9_9LECA|nr:MAG: hypothetical protein ALECFALPRED_006349 [Alectoria fallacina]
MPTIAFLLSTSPNKIDPDGMHQFMELQTQIHALPTPIPLLPIPTPPHLLRILQTYATPPSPRPAPTTAQVPTLGLLPYVTSTAPARPLSAHVTNVLSDLCGSLKEVARLCETGGGRGVLGEWLGEEEGKGVAEFWEGEWIVE